MILPSAQGDTRVGQPRYCPEAGCDSQRSTRQPRTDGTTSASHGPRLLSHYPMRCVGRTRADASQLAGAPGTRRWLASIHSAGARLTPACCFLVSGSKSGSLAGFALTRTCRVEVVVVRLRRCRDPVGGGCPWGRGRSEPDRHRPVGVPGQLAGGQLLRSQLGDGLDRPH